MDHDFNVFQSFCPENLHFTMNDEDISTIEYEITASAMDLDGDPVITGNDFISPHNTHWQLRYGPSIIIMAGVHTSVEMDYGGNYMSVSGADWMWYLAQRFMPFDGRAGHINDFIIGTPPEGLAYEDTSVDVVVAIQTIAAMIFGRDNSIPIDFGDPDPAGVDATYYRIDLADTTSFLSIVQDLCAIAPGTAFEITPDLFFEAVSPRWYGDPNDIANDSGNSNLIWTIDDDHPPLNLKFTNTGPGATHVQGSGEGTGQSNVSSLSNVDNQEVYWRTDKSYDFQNTIHMTDVINKTQERLTFDINPIHEIPIILDPSIVDAQYEIDQSHSPGDDDGFFWTNFKPGRAIWIDLQLIAHHIQSAHHIVSMDCTLNSSGVMMVSLTENQIYDTSGQASTPEG